MSADRSVEGARLAQSLAATDRTGDVVVGIPKGGAMVGAKVALELGAAYECVPVCRISAPCFPGLTLGAIDPDGNVLFAPESQLTRYEVTKSRSEFAEHLRREAARCRGDRTPVEFAGRTLIVVDDAADSHIVAQAAAEYLRSKGAARLVFATPIAAEEVLPRLRQIYDEVVARKVVPRSRISGFYGTFVSDDEVHDCMTRAWDASPETVHA